MLEILGLDKVQPESVKKLEEIVKANGQQKRTLETIHRHLTSD